MNDKKRPLPYPDDPSATPVWGEPQDVWEQINKYGTYEVQDTTDSDNLFPYIGPESGLPLYPSIPKIPPQKPE